jgi:hypothetical protein
LGQFTLDFRVEVGVTRPRGVSVWRSKEADPAVALSKQDCKCVIGGKAERGDSAALVPTDSAGSESLAEAGWLADDVDTPLASWPNVKLRIAIIDGEEEGGAVIGGGRRVVATAHSRTRRPSLGGPGASII